MLIEKTAAYNIKATELKGEEYRRDKNAYMAPTRQFSI